MGSEESKSRLCKQCRECKYKNTCNDKRMEALAYMSGTNENGTSNTVDSLMQHEYRDIKIAENTTVTIDLKEIRHQVEQSFFPNLMQSATRSK